MNHPHSCPSPQLHLPVPAVSSGGLRPLFGSLVGLALLLPAVFGCSEGGASAASSPKAGEPPTGIDPSSVVVAGNPTAAAALSPGRYQLGSGASDGNCLGEGANSSVAAVACNAARGAQRWTLTQVSPGLYRVDSGLSGNSLDVKGGGKSAGTAVQVYGYGKGSANRRFRVTDAGSGAVQMESENAPGLCLSLAEGGAAVLGACGDPATRWYLYQVSQAPAVGRGLNGGGCLPNPALKVAPASATRIAELGTPIDLNQQDLEGPDSWNGNYGKQPEFVAAPQGTGVDVLWKDQKGDKSAVIVHLEPGTTGYTLTRAWRVGLLDNLMGYAVGEDGLRYYATGVEGKLVNATYPPNDIHRPDIVRLVGFDETGCVRVEVDLDLARGYFDETSAILINPMTASTSRLAYGGGVLALVHGANTQPDSGGTRHQMSRTTYVDVKSGEVVRASSQWVSHSFDQRELWDGERFLELHLGDTYPRGIDLGRFGVGVGAGDYLTYQPKGTGNATYTRLGGVAPISSGDFGWFVLFSTERSPTVGSSRDSARDSALVRVKRNFDSLDSKDVYVDQAGTPLAVNSGGTDVVNHLTWLTDYGVSGTAADAAERPRVLALGGDQFLLLWEHWNGKAFDGTWGMVVDAAGKAVKPPAKLGPDHISRGDDAILVGGRGLLFTGVAGKLVVTTIGADLAVQRQEIP